jgi:hypothetical protein
MAIDRAPSARVIRSRQSIMNRAEADVMVRDVTKAWLDDPDASVVWAGSFEGRRGIRMTQECREATTIWFQIGQRTVGYEAYLLPSPPHDAQEVYRQCLARNHRSWPAAVSVDERGDLYIRGRITLSDLDADRLDEAVGTVYQLVEISFRPLLLAGFGHREKSL